MKLIQWANQFISLARKGAPERTSDEASIRHTDGVAGGDACVRDTRIPVWTLVQLKKLGRTESELLTDYPGLAREDLDAAWNYYRDHTDEIENAIAAEAMED
jgi:uncharacterized protein (DUF433 family)